MYLGFLLGFCRKERLQTSSIAHKSVISSEVPWIDAPLHDEFVLFLYKFPIYDGTLRDRPMQVVSDSVAILDRSSNRSPETEIKGG